MTNLRSLSHVLRAARKLAAACAFAIAIAAATSAQTNTFPSPVTVGNINGHTQLYSGYDSQTPSILEVGYGTATSSDVPFSALVLSKNATGTTQYIGSLFWANRAIADGNEKRLAQIAVATDGATNSGLLTFNITDAGTLAERMRITKGGNVGIGTTNPNGSLEVQGAGQNNTVRVINTNAVSGGLYSQNTQTTGQAVVYTDNNRGFYAAYGGILTGGSANVHASLFGLSRADQTFVFADGPSSQGLAVGTLTGRPLILGTSNAERVRIDSSGNVGIGKPDPQYKLDVFGDIKASGTIHAKYQDLAEWVPSSEQLSAGTVVVLDTTKSNQVISSGTAYDTRVAGVISAQPGITLGESGEGKVLVATTGRVRVKVDASRGPIQIGDLLVTSDVSGVAMKSEPVEFAGRKMHMPGTIIGKALEPLAKGQGEILVLLSLQ